MPRKGTSWSSLYRSGLVAPQRTTYSSLVLILNEDDPEIQNKMTEQWRDHKLAELNFIGVVGALLAGVLTSTGSWPPILSAEGQQPWQVRAFWFCGTLFALFAVLTAAQQSLRLHRLSAHRDGLAFIRRCIEDSSASPPSRRHGSSRDGDGAPRKPRWVQVYAWQASIALLTAAVFCMVGGMLFLVWISTQMEPYRGADEPWWNENSKLAVTFTVVLVVTLSMFLVAQASFGDGRDNSEDDV